MPRGIPPYEVAVLVQAVGRTPGVLVRFLAAEEVGFGAAFLLGVVEHGGEQDGAGAGEGLGGVVAAEVEEDSSRGEQSEDGGGGIFGDVEGVQAQEAGLVEGWQGGLEILQDGLVGGA
jgi:hypothetical protein